MTEQRNKPIPNPCVGVCALDENDLCIACQRSGIEIAEWGVYTNEEKVDVWKKIKQRESGDFSE
ncbi:DUF1289 domain-containing protein [Neptuniibacter sp. 2_MG-2023]|uniref:DUF1289 domain-containing protein n=1 Tax=Neptuniibacter sp. 2_MG-2023 TaxID=3062671 RepID=UPI0026E1F259|nr:DUF1289 domain-containing protein [Neptuniibacter sp. 2_MG-2023]MDO6513754.1 DUF1289 domain-containing protein [Neptuniibacter sp. 2_MG-2023]